LSRFGTFTINGTEYDLDDLTLDEIEEVENLADGVFSELNYGSAKVMKAMAFILLKRTTPDIQFEDVGKVKLIDFAQPEEEMPVLPPVGDEGQTNQSESEPEGFGVPPSVVSITG
jgi:hypothetical protein